MQQHEGFSKARHCNQWVREGYLALNGFSQYQQTQDLLHFMQALKGVSENLSQLKRAPLDLLHSPILSMLIALNLLIAPHLWFPPIKFKKIQNPTTQQCFKKNYYYLHEEHLFLRKS